MRRRRISESRRTSPWRSLLSAAWLPAATPVKAKPAVPASKKAPKKSLIKRKRYRSSAVAKKSPDAKPVASTRHRRSRVTAAVHHVVIPKGPPVTPRARLAAHDVVYQRVSTGASIPVENAAALVPFFELLYRHQKGQIEGPLESCTTAIRTPRPTNGRATFAPAFRKSSATEAADFRSPGVLIMAIAARTCVQDRPRTGTPMVSWDARATVCTVWAASA